MILIFFVLNRVQDIYLNKVLGIIGIRQYMHRTSCVEFSIDSGKASLLACIGVQHDVIGH